MWEGSGEALQKNIPCPVSNYHFQLVSFLFPSQYLSIDLDQIDHSQTQGFLKVIRMTTSIQAKLNKSAGIIRLEIFFNRRRLNFLNFHFKLLVGVFSK